MENVILKHNVFGIYAADSPSQNISIDNCVMSYGFSAIELVAFSHNLLVKNSQIYDYEWVIFSYSYSHGALKDIKLENCILGRNHYVIDPYYGHAAQAVILRNCTLVENSYLYRHFYPLQVTLDVSECNVSGTNYSGFDINLGQFEGKISLINNTFFGNSRTVLSITKNVFSATQQSSILIDKNIFVNNSLSTGDGLIDFAGKGIGTIFTNVSENNFTQNFCSFLIKVFAQSNGESEVFSIKHNVLKDNKAALSDPTNVVEADVHSYSVGLLGCTFSHYNIQYNVFDNELMQKELFVGHSCGSNYINEKFDVDAKFNYWGSSAWDFSQRIFHFADWNDRPRVNYLPAFATRNFTDVITSEVSSSKSQIGGYIDSFLRLTTSYSPYIVITDLTIAENVTLEIEPGVKLYFKPNVGLLVLGNIIALGTTNKDIELCALESKCENKQPMIRLVGGDLENIGILEILVGGLWQAACRYYFTSGVGEVACRQLGYDRYINHDSRFYGYYGSAYKVYFNCNGNETTLFDCKNQTVSNCGHVGGIYLECGLKMRNRKKWGNIRIVLPKPFNSGENNRVYEQSLLGNIRIHGAGFLHDQSVSSIQVLGRSPSIANVSIVQSQGITIIGQRDTITLKDINVENNSGFPSIAILGNKGIVSISRASIREGNHSGIAIGPIINTMPLMHSFVGHDLCDPVPKIYISGSSYVFLNQKSWIKDVFCSLEIISPTDTMVHFQLLFWVRNSYSIRIKYGGNIYYLSNYQYLDQVTVIPSDSFIIEAEISILREFLAEITVVNKTGEETSTLNKIRYFCTSFFAYACMPVLLNFT